ncbi:MAG: tetratricopeptide repeat protein [Cyanobacteria bacterium P01_F01_bin.86]
MGAVVEVTSQTFEEAVLEKSFEMPVLVDFFAQWCGPCQMLKPLLEKLTQEYEFVLAKIDIDQNPELARIYQVEGVPDVKVVWQGQVHNGFVGMLSEPQIRDLLAQLNLKSAFEEGMAAIAAAKALGDLKKVKSGYEGLLAQYPERTEVILEAAQFRLGQGDLAGATALLDKIDPYQRPYGDQAVALRSLMAFHAVVKSRDVVRATEADALYLAGAQAVIAEDYETALEQFLALVKCDRRYREDAGRKALLTLFAVLGDDHALTHNYRKRLMQTLY